MNVVEEKDLIDLNCLTEQVLQKRASFDSCSSKSFAVNIDIHFSFFNLDNNTN